MSKLDLGSIGVSLNVTPDDAYLEQAGELERLGYSAIWLSGGQIDSLSRITKVVQATTSARVVTGILSPDVYDADAVAALYANLESAAPGRFIPGLGASQKPHALPPLHDYLDRLDDAKPPVPASRRILAALGPRKLDIARERFAGAVTLLVNPEFTAGARRRLGTEPVLVVDQFVVLDPDPARARETARGPLRFLSRVGGYAANFTRMGFTDADIADLSDRLVDDLVAWGDADTIAARVREHVEAGADHVVLGILNAGGEQPSHPEAARQLAALLISND
jgi:probable F420-dependent oxidoreductase